MCTSCFPVVNFHYSKQIQCGVTIREVARRSYFIQVSGQAIMKYGKEVFHTAAMVSKYHFSACDSFVKCLIHVFVVFNWNVIASNVYYENLQLTWKKSKKKFNVRQTLENKVWKWRFVNLACQHLDIWKLKHWNVEEAWVQWMIETYFCRRVRDELESILTQAPM